MLFCPHISTCKWSHLHRAFILVRSTFLACHIGVMEVWKICIYPIVRPILQSWAYRSLSWMRFLPWRVTSWCIQHLMISSEHHCSICLLTFFPQLDKVNVDVVTSSTPWIISYSSSMWMRDSSTAVNLHTVPQHVLNKSESRTPALAGELSKCVRQQCEEALKSL